jgi:hypothetical protein
MLFPWHFQFLAVIVLIVSLALITERTVLSVVLMAASVFILSGHSGIEIDKKENYYREYNSFFLIKLGEKIKYAGIEKIYVNTSKMREQLYTAHTSHSSVFINMEFNGYMKFEDGTKVHVLSRRKKADLTKALKKISQFLNVRVEDNTVPVE